MDLYSVIIGNKIKNTNTFKNYVHYNGLIVKISDNSKKFLDESYKVFMSKQI
jgi:hypothetical protein